MSSNQSDKPKNPKLPVIAAFAAGIMTSAGQTVKLLDENKTGSDDFAGMLLSVGGEAISGIVGGDESKSDRAAIGIALGALAYCRERGLSVPGVQLK